MTKFNVGKKRIYRSIIKAVYRKPLVNFIFNGKKVRSNSSVGEIASIDLKKYYRGNLLLT